MRIVMAAAECAPFAKVGGLGDVMGALPKELAKLGHDVTVMLPMYSQIPVEYTALFSEAGELEVPFGSERANCRVSDYMLNGVRHVFFEQDRYYARDGVYAGEDNDERYGFFARAVLEFLLAQEDAPDLIHVHDWHTAFIPFLLREDSRYGKLSERAKTVLTIHNLQFQGAGPADVLTEKLGMDARFIEDGTVMWHDRLNVMKTGILYADAVTTVSPSYRDEVLTEQFGEGLHPLLQEKGESFIGIVNGIDTDAYNPADDRMITKEYDLSSLDKKALNKRAVQAKFGLPEREEVPLLAMVSRLSGQKGIDVLQEVLPELLQSEDVQFVLLGSGEERFESFFRQLADQFPDKAAAHLGFDEVLAHLMYAGADIFLMPSHFEPCGLSQLISMRYGTVPVASRTGGLKDTVAEYDETARSGTGFLCDLAQGESFTDPLNRALNLYRRREHWEVLMRNGMGGDYSWSRSAEAYVRVYETVTGK